MKRKYGIMLIGCGHIGGEHLEDIYYREEFSIEAVIDQVGERARSFAARYNARHSGTDYRPFLQSAAVDIVIIATYADTHLALLEECLAAGKHVLCEKPIASTLEDGRRFYHLVKESSCKVLVAHILRHNRSYQTIARLIREGAVGRLRLMRMVQNHHALDWPRYQRLMEDCPPIVDCGVHYLDVMQWFADSPVVEVGGMSCRLDPDAPRDNFGMIQVRLANGCVGYYEAGWGKNLSAQNVKEFVGDEGRITLTLRENRSENREEGDLIALYRSDTGEYRTINVESKYKDMYAQMKTLVDMIENDAPADPRIEEVYSAFRIAVTAEEAIRRHTTLTVGVPFPSDKKRDAS